MNTFILLAEAIKQYAKGQFTKVELRKMISTELIKQSEKMKTYYVLDLVQRTTVFEGSYIECNEWVSKQSDYFTYSVSPFIQ